MNDTASALEEPRKFGRFIEPGGFGDITPVSKVARTLSALEAVTGTFYLAILVSRLVGMYSPTIPPDNISQAPTPSSTSHDH